MKMRVMRVPTSSPPLKMPERLALSDSEKAEAVVDSLEAQFKPVDDPSEQAWTDMFGEAMRTSEHAPARELSLTTTSEVLQTNRAFQVDKFPGPNSKQEDGRKTSSSPPNNLSYESDYLTPT
jgi:hypothetical protein